MTRGEVWIWTGINKDSPSAMGSIGIAAAVQVYTATSLVHPTPRGRWLLDGLAKISTRLLWPQTNFCPKQIHSGLLMILLKVAFHFSRQRWKVQPLEDPIPLTNPRSFRRTSGSSLDISRTEGSTACWAEMTTVPSFPGQSSHGYSTCFPSALQSGHRSLQLNSFACSE